MPGSEAKKARDRARMKRIRDAEGWQQMESVPRDGTRVLFGWIGCEGDYACGPQAIGYYSGKRLQLDNADDNEKVHPQVWSKLPIPKPS